MNSIYQAVLEGRPLPTHFIDVHGHFGPWPETVIPWAMDRPRIIAEMDRYGCDQVWMTASNPGYSDDVSVKNDYVFDFAREYPDRIIPYCTLSANFPQQAAAELKRCLTLGRCIGVKMHRYQQQPYTLRSDFLQVVLEMLQEQRLVYMNHELGDECDMVWALEKYPDLVFMSGHYNGPTNDLVMKYPNLRGCTCGINIPGVIEREVRRAGWSDAMLVGSDFSLFQLGFGVGMIAYARIDEARQRNILGLNALKLLERTKWYKDLRFPLKN